MVYQPEPDRTGIEENGEPSRFNDGAHHIHHEWNWMNHPKPYHDGPDNIHHDGPDGSVPGRTGGCDLF